MIVWRGAVSLPNSASVTTAATRMPTRATAAQTLVLVDIHPRYDSAPRHGGVRGAEELWRAGLRGHGAMTVPPPTQHRGQYPSFKRLRCQGCRQRSHGIRALPSSTWPRTRSAVCVSYRRLRLLATERVRGDQIGAFVTGVRGAPDNHPHPI